ncbi:MAG: hypothetical protein ACYSWP_23310, partial [Planctomycetota bacterium]
EAITVYDDSEQPKRLINDHLSTIDVETADILRKHFMECLSVSELVDEYQLPRRTIDERIAKGLAEMREKIG